MMSKKFYIFRLKYYLRKNGFKRTLFRLIKKSQQLLNSRYDVLYHVDIAHFSNINAKRPESIVILRQANENEIENATLKSLYEYREKKIVRHQFHERFRKGALLWILKINNDLAGFLWSIRKSPIEHFFFPLTNYDIYFFDIMIIPSQRNKGIFPLFMHSVLSELKKEGFINGYIATNNWNTGMTRSTSKTAFQKIGSAKKLHIFGKDIVIWKEMSAQRGLV